MADSLTNVLIVCSASLYRIAPYLEISRPNCKRSLAYLTDSVMACFAPPITPAANLILPMFNMFRAILNPFSLSESKFSTGTLTSLKKTCLVEDPLIPIFFSSGFNVIPSESASIKNAVSLSSSSIFANTVNRFAKPAFVIHIF